MTSARIRPGAWAAVLAVALAGCAPSGERAQQPASPSASADAYAAMLTTLERESGGRLGVALVDPQGRVVLANRADERFALCSTFKLPLAMMLLEEARAGRIDPERTVNFLVADQPGHSPRMLAAAQDGQGRISLRDAARAAVEVSDNGAANVVLAALGGPHALTRRFAQWGDRVTRLDRTEPTLNENAPDDRRDTTSPVAMATLIGRMARNQILAPADSETLRQWSRASETGLRRIRAGLPQGMIAGDKTGTCGQPHEAVNDVVWFHAAGEAPGSSWSLAVYLDRPTVDTARANAILGEIGRIADLRIRDAAAR